MPGPWSILQRFLCKFPVDFVLFFYFLSFLFSVFCLPCQQMTMGMAMMMLSVC